MNIWVVLLWILVIVAVVILVVLSTTAITNWVRHNSTVEPAGTKCTPPIDRLIPLEGLPCCMSGPTLTASRYIPSLDLVVNPMAVPYIQACQGFCGEGVVTDNGVTRCVNGIGQAAFVSCVDATQPVDCRGASYPIAALGATYFYANSATNAACTLTRPCAAL